jgi:acetyl esterase/lipase
MTRRTRIRGFSAAVLIAALGWVGPRGAPAVSPQPTPFEGVLVQRAVPYVMRDGLPLLMDVYLPPQSASPGSPPGGGAFPAVMLIHGGGFRLGDRTDIRGVGVFLAMNGYVCFSIDYRLAPRFPYPAAVQDAQSALAYMRAHAALFQVDPTRIAAMGGSAGGTIAASVGALSGRGRTGIQVGAVVSWSGALDLLRVGQERPAAIPTVTGYASGDPSATLAADQAQLRTASPIDQVKPGAPPMFIANSARELMPFDQAQAMVAKLHTAGVVGELFTAPGGHSFDYTRSAEPPSLRFLDQYVRSYSGADWPPPSTTPAPSGTASPSPAAGHKGISVTSILIVLILLGLGALLARQMASNLRRATPADDRRRGRRRPDGWPPG